MGPTVVGKPLSPSTGNVDLTPRRRKQAPEPRNRLEGTAVGRGEPIAPDRSGGLLPLGPMQGAHDTGMGMNDVTRRRLIFLGGFALYFGALWLLWDTPVVYPLKIFVVLLHEVSHAVAAVVTGGHVDRIVLDPYQGGAAYVAGGNAFVTLSAGYLGSLVWGVLLVLAAQATWMRTRVLTGFIGAVVLLLTILYVRSLFGVVFGLAFGAAMLIVARKLSEETNRMIVLVLGLTSALYAILDIKSDILDRPHLRSDAAMLAEITGIPTTVYGIVWIVIAVGVSAWLFQRSFKRA